MCQRVAVTENGKIEEEDDDDQKWLLTTNVLRKYHTYHQSSGRNGGKRGSMGRGERESQVSMTVIEGNICFWVLRDEEKEKTGETRGAM